MTNDEFDNSTVPNGIWLTLNERKSMGLSDEYVIIYATGDGTYYALDTAHVDDAGENPVVALSPDGQQLEIIAEDFGKFFYDTIHAIL